MSEDDLKVPEELFKDVKFYVVGDIDQKVYLTVIRHSFSLLANSGLLTGVSIKANPHKHITWRKVEDTFGQTVFNVTLEYIRVYLFRTPSFVCMVYSPLSAVSESPVFSMLAIISDNNATLPTLN